MKQKKDENLELIREEMRTLMTADVGVFREETGLKGAVEALKMFHQRAAAATLINRSLKMNQELIQRWELDNLLAVAMTMAQGALQRRESRGGHARSDFPDRSNRYNEHTLAYMTRYGDIAFAQRPVDMSLFNGEEPEAKKFGIIERKY